MTDFVRACRLGESVYMPLQKTNSIYMYAPLNPQDEGPHVIFKFFYRPYSTFSPSYIEYLN